MGSSAILNPGRVKVFLADTGTAAPADATEAPAVGWKEVGLTTPDSLSVSFEPEFQEVVSHQSDYPTRRIQTSDSASISVDLQEWNSDNLKASFGGGTVTEVTPATTPPTYKFIPPALGARAEKSAIIDVIDGTKVYRWVFPRVQQVEGVQSDFQKGQEARLPLRLAVLGEDGVDPFYVLTNDPAITPDAP